MNSVSSYKSRFDHSFTQLDQSLVDANDSAASCNNTQQQTLAVQSLPVAHDQSLSPANNRLFVSTHDSIQAQILDRIGDITEDAPIHYNPTCDEDNVSVKQIVDQLAADFFNLSESFTVGWQLYRAYARCCSHAVKCLSAKIQQSTSFPPQLDISQSVTTAGEQLTNQQLNQLIELLIGERDTWLLFYALSCESNIDYSKGTSYCGAEDCEGGNSEQAHAAKLFATNRELSRAQLVVDWLEDCYGRGLRSRDLLTDTDMGVSRCVFALVRAGRIAEAQSMCASVGQFWRSAILEGWRHYMDPNQRCRCDRLLADPAEDPAGVVDTHSSYQVHPVSGNPRRRLWCQCVRDMCTHEAANHDVYERALYGVQAGHTHHALSVCGTWHDYMWTLMRQFVAEQVVGMGCEASGDDESRDPVTRTCADVRAVVVLATQHFARQLSGQSKQQPSGNNSSRLHTTALSTSLDCGGGTTLCAEDDTCLHSVFLRVQRHLIMTNLSAAARCVVDACLLSDTCVHRSSYLRALFHLTQVFADTLGAAEAVDTVLEFYVGSLVDNYVCVSVYVQCVCRLRSQQARIFRCAELLRHVSPLPSAPVAGGGDREQLVSAWQAQEERRRHTLTCVLQAGLSVRHTLSHMVTVTYSSVTQPHVPSADTASSTATTSSTSVAYLLLDWYLLAADLSATQTQEQSQEEQSQQSQGDSVTTHTRAVWVRDTVCVCLRLCRMYLLQHRVTEVRLAVARLPATALATLGQEAGPDTECPLARELLCVHVLVSALDTYGVWWGHLARDRPRKPVTHATVTAEELLAGVTGSVRLLVQEQRRRDYEQRLLRWKLKLRSIGERAAEAFYRVLCFPDGGWLVIRSRPDDIQAMVEGGSEVVESERAALRSMYSAEVMSALVNVLRASEVPHKVLQLADVIASDDYLLYSCLKKEQLRNFLQTIRHFSVELLNKKYDAFGYELC